MPRGKGLQKAEDDKMRQLLAEAYDALALGLVEILQCEEVKRYLHQVALNGAYSGLQDLYEKDAARAKEGYPRSYALVKYSNFYRTYKRELVKQALG
jgi:hypothetical protein